ncbi:3-keto-L-gulonate-6-phosphate decarboxylase UlaD [Candidatus Izimaplasma bacterium HR1]|jgi:3-keto-L-gulonate-6-phosphate decarboxylase|uniref:3-keto-L-gulonate-6-phosphate decarboxylase UlaD n=1 Tax=Candidatus Izimoplasma sp. HR1 TaxID=1541959 RepID=UPI0004F8328A|nr:3-keto-L-gulonate-6-phosphate decarboxylase UlaD [Candidatus Izimaplasma bacterium HR1]
MKLPLLQVALDETSLENAVKSVKQYGHIIDIVEVGTILHYAEGAKAVSVLREMYPNKILLDDIKGADAGKTLAEICFGAGADTMTAICSADVNTMIAMKKVGDSYGEGKDVQVELYGDWTFEHAQSWLDAGLSQVVYHRSRDAELAGQKWGQSDIDKIAKLIEMGIKVTITGGLNVEDLELFNGLAIHGVIAGRSIRGAKNPEQAAKDFKAEIARIWG